MKNNKQPHPFRFPAYMLAAALILCADCHAMAASRTGAQAYTPGPSVCGAPANSPGMDLRKQKRQTGRGIINKIELSLEDAVSLAQNEAVRYYDDLHLTNVYSYDNDRAPQMSSGADGRRQWWYVNFANEKQNYVSILICDGQILNTEHFDSNANNGLFDLSDAGLTAGEAAKKAQALGLRGGNPEKSEEWVSGFNFRLSFSSLVESPDDKRLFFEVIGISPNGNFAHVDFDAMTGGLLLAEEKIEYKNGDVEWKKF